MLRNDFYFILSFDVEGLNFGVLQGSMKTLEKILLHCVEFDDETEKLKLIDIVKPNFNLIMTYGCNLILKTLN